LKRPLASRPGISTGTIRVSLGGASTTDVLKVFVKLLEEFYFDFKFVSLALPRLIRKPKVGVGSSAICRFPARDGWIPTN